MKAGFPQLEIAVTGAAGARIAQKAGADRVELCSGLELGGITPSQGNVEHALHETAGSLGIHALIRPRPGDFCYSPDELATSEREIQALVRQGVAGIVIGALCTDGTIAVGATRRLIDAAREINSAVQITFHRAIDQTVDAVAATESLLGLGINRLLSSGRAGRAIDGLATLGAMVNAGAGNLEIMAGGGVRVEDVADLVSTAGVDAVHLSAKRPGQTTGIAGVSLGSGDGADPRAYFITDSDVVRQAVAAILEIRQPTGERSRR